MSDTNETIDTSSELAALKSRADLMKIPYHPSIGLEKLREKVNEAVSSTSSNQSKSDAVETPQVESENALRGRLRREASALVRIRLSCMNPAKKEWEGEIITVGNSVVGTFSKYVPFNADEGWHVPKIILDTLQERQCQIFYTPIGKDGKKGGRTGKLIKEFAIEILPMLTPEELHDLAQRQALGNTVG
jgi:hypothetical protein